MEEELRSGIETLKDIAEGAVPPEVSIDEAKAILKRYKDLEEENNKLEEENKKLKDNYKNQIEQTTILAKALNLEEDAPIDEMYAEINKLKTNSIPTSVIQNKLSEIDEKIKNYKSLQELHELQAQKFILELILEKGNK